MDPKPSNHTTTWPQHNRDPMIKIISQGKRRPQPPLTFRALPTHSTLSAVVYSDILRNTDHNSNIFSQPHFTGFCKTLDSEMKRLRSLGTGVNRKQNEPLTVEEGTACGSNVCLEIAHRRH